MKEFGRRRDLFHKAPPGIHYYPFVVSVRLGHAGSLNHQEIYCRVYFQFGQERAAWVCGQSFEQCTGWTFNILKDRFKMVGRKTRNINRMVMSLESDVVWNVFANA